MAAMALEAALAGVLAVALQVRAARSSASRVPAALLDQHMGRGLVPSCRGLRRRAPWAHGNDLRAPGDDSQPGPLPTTPRQTGTTTAPSSRHPGRSAATAAAPGPPRRTRTPWRAPVQAPAPDHRIDQSDLQKPAPPRTPRQAHARRSHGAHPAAHSGPDCSDLAQRPHRRTVPPVAHRLRPLTFA